MLLDPDTAHLENFLSQDRKSVRRRPSSHSLSNNPERSACWLCLGWGQLPSGRHNWEVEDGNVMVWAVGFSADRVQRKGEALLVPQISGSWSC